MAMCDESPEINDNKDDDCCVCPVKKASHRDTADDTGIPKFVPAWRPKKHRKPKHENLSNHHVCDRNSKTA